MIKKIIQKFDSSLKKASQEYYGDQADLTQLIEKRTLAFLLKEEVYDE